MIDQAGTDRSILEIEILESNSATLAKALPSCLDSAEEPRIIKSVRGVGYVFASEVSPR